VTYKLSTADSLRLLADWYEQHPDMPAPEALRVYSFGSDAEKVREIARALGTFDKDHRDAFLELSRRFGSLRIDIIVHHEAVCTKRKVMKMVEVEEWDCEPLLADEEAAA
jgi:hypothetical protein